FEIAKGPRAPTQSLSRKSHGCFDSVICRDVRGPPSSLRTYRPATVLVGVPGGTVSLKTSTVLSPNAPRSDVFHLAATPHAGAMGTAGITLANCLQNPVEGASATQLGGVPCVSGGHTGGCAAALASDNSGKIIPKSIPALIAPRLPRTADCVLRAILGFTGNRS